MATLQNKMREKLAELFQESLEKDQLPWKACWQVSTPENAVSGKKYKGINALMLSFASAQAGLGDHRWCTFRQASEKGWFIRKGAKGWPVEYWAYFDKEKKKLLNWAEARKAFLETPDYANENLVLRSRIYTVFNGSQIEGIPEIQQMQNVSPESIRSQRDTLFRNMQLNLQEGVTQPYYAPETDTVCLPYERDFYDSYSYACTMLHECGHATGHPTRLNRDLSAGFGTSEYAKEELRAEIASAFAAQALGLHLTDAQLEGHMRLHTAYIQSWAKSIREAPEELMKAIRDGEAIANYLIEKGEFCREKENTMNTEARSTSVGRLDFLGSSGAVAESVEYSSPEDFLSAIREEAHAGAPFTVVLYEDADGKTIPTDFTKDLECPFMEIKREPNKSDRGQAGPVNPVRSVKEQMACAKMAARNQTRRKKSGHSMER